MVAEPTPAPKTTGRVLLFPSTTPISDSLRAQLDRVEREAPPERGADITLDVNTKGAELSASLRLSRIFTAGAWAMTTWSGLREAGLRVKASFR